VVNPDGTGQRLLEEGIDYDILPQWSPDSRELAFVKHHGIGPPGTPATTQVYIIGVDGNDRRLLLEDKEALDLYLVGWRPDGRQLIYHRFVPEGDQLWTFDLKEGRASLVTTLSRTPAYGVHLSPKGDRVVASLRQGRGSFAVVSVGLEDQPRESISEGNRKPSNAIFSPDGQRIAYDTDPGEQQPRSLQLLEVATSNVVLLAANDGSKDVPLSFSPDGRWLLVRQHQKERAPLYLLELEKGTKEYVVSNYWVEPIGWTRG
jgi:Tol biopolymer transport system component